MTHRSLRRYVWAVRVSNPRPLACHASALPTELTARRDETLAARRGADGAAIQTRERAATSAKSDSIMRATRALKLT